LERLRDQGLISVVGQIAEEATEAAAVPTPYVRTKDPQWYAAQAASVRAELESMQAELQDYIQAIEDARELMTMTGGMNLDQGDIGITLEAGIEILQRRVREIQSELDALEDLARHNGIPPGTLRGRS
jgi:phage host-nuclease inhibitor protein Gam